MAVKAKAEITISRIIDIEKVTRYYLLQSSTSATPSKPTAIPPGGSWVTTEPAFGSDTTKTLYFVDLTIMTNGAFSYSAVSKSSSYEAAKEAWNKANNAQNTANDAKNKVDNLQVGGRNLLSDSKFDKLSWKKNNDWINISNTNGTRYSFTTDGLRTVINTGWGGTGFMIHVDKIPLIYGTPITVSMDLKIISGDAKFTSSANTATSSDWWTQSVNRYNIFGIDEAVKNKGTWVRVGFTMIIPSGESMYEADRVLMFRIQTTNGEYYQRRVKIEIGNKATDWSPAPEDLETTVETVSQTVSEIEHTVESNTARIESLSQTVSTKADGSRVESLEKTVNTVQQTANENVSKITQVTESVKNAQSAADSANSKIDGLQVGGRNLALNTTAEYSAPFMGFDGRSNICLSLGKVLAKGLNVGDTVVVRLIYKYTDLVPVEGLNGCTIWLQGNGNITQWYSGAWGTSSHMTLSGSGEKIIVYKFKITENHLKNDYWSISIRHDYVHSGSVQWKELKVEKGTIPTAWSPAPEDLVTQESFTALSTTVNEVKQTADSNSASITKLDGKIATKADNTTVTEVTERVAKAEQNLSGFKTTVKNTYTTKTDFENLQVGGRNLYYLYKFSEYYVNQGTGRVDNGEIILTATGSDLYVGNAAYNSASSISGGMGPVFDVENIDNITISISNELFAYNYYSFFDANRKVVAGPFSAFHSTLKTISIPSGVKYMVLRVGYAKAIVGETYRLKIKVEKGTIATDWTPAPEDLIAEAQNYATTAKNEAISAAASDATSKVNKGIKQATSIAAGDAAAKANQTYSDAKNYTMDSLKKYVKTTTYDSYVEQTDRKIAAKLESSEFTSFQDGEYTSFKQSTNEFIGTVDKWEMKWDKIFNSADANEDTYQSYITFQNGEQILGNSKSNIKLHLKNDIIQFEDSNGNALASFDATTIYLGKSSSDSVIDLCNGAGKIKGVNYEHNSQLSIYGTEGITLYPTENNNVFASLDSSSIWLYAHNAEETKGSSIIITSNGINITSDDDVSIIGAPLVLWGELQAHSDATFETKITVPTIYTNNWFRSTGNSGWYNENYGGGIFMEDTTWVKVYNGKSFYAPGEIRSDNHMTVNGLGSYGQFRAIYGNYGFLIRNDGVNTYFLTTNAGDPWGGWSNTYPMLIDNANGQVTFNQRIIANGSARICGGGKAALMSGSGNWISVNSNESSGGHGSLGSGDNYWTNLYYSGALKKVSDKRKKRDLGELSLDETLTVLGEIKTVKYSMLSDSEDVVQYGVFAQDIRDMLQKNHLGYRSMLSVSYIGSEKDTTNLYESEDNVTYSVDYLQFIAPLIKGWQYHESELEELKRAHQELQGKYNSLEGQIEALRDKLHELEMAM